MKNTIDIIEINDQLKIIVDEDVRDIICDLYYNLDKKIYYFFNYNFVIYNIKTKLDYDNNETFYNSFRRGFIS